MKKFIFNADDLGLSSLTTQGILNCQNIVKSASLMVTSESAQEAFNQASENNISIGIHLNVSGEGNFINQSVNLGKSGPINQAYKNNEQLPYEILNEIVLEFDDQIQLFRTKFNTDPSHINFHHPLYHIPNFTEIFRQFLENKSIPTRWFRDLGSVSIPHPDHTEFGFYNKSDLTVRNLINLMNQAPQGVTEFVLHPGLFDETLDSSYKEERALQVEILTDPTLVNHIYKNGWQIINFDEIK